MPSLKACTRRSSRQPGLPWSGPYSPCSSCPRPMSQCSRKRLPRTGRVTLKKSVDQPTVGLRERKRARTRAEIQGHALRLFRQQGYEATTVHQIIEEAEVSESTFFRYFPTKAEVVLFDGMDALIVDT